MTLTVTGPLLIIWSVVLSPFLPKLSIHLWRGGLNCTCTVWYDQHYGCIQASRYTIANIMGLHRKANSTCVHREPAAWCTQWTCSMVYTGNLQHGVHREPAAWVYTGRPAAVYQHYGLIWYDVTVMTTFWCSDDILYFVTQYWQLFDAAITCYTFNSNDNLLMHQWHALTFNAVMTVYWCSMTCYTLWRSNDNSLMQRLHAKHFNTVFSNNNLLMHQWHSIHSNAFYTQ